MRTLLLITGVLLLATPARADDGDWGVPKPEPAPLTTEPPASCAVNEREGFTEADVAATEQVLCGHIRESGHPGQYRIHLGKLGAKVVVTLVEWIDGTTLERQVVLSDLGELSVAAPRLVEANNERKSVGDTLDVTNVVGDEARAPKKRASTVHAWLGFIGAGSSGGTGGGMNIGMSAGSDRWSFVGDLRLAGETFNKPAVVVGEIFTLGLLDAKPDSNFGYMSLTGGIRYHLALSDTTPFLGAGLGVDYIAHDGAKGSYVYEAPSTGKGGLAGYGEIGLDVLRTRLVGGSIAIRADLPAFAAEETKPDPNNQQRYLARTVYSPIFSAGIAFRF
jgi:hypothetical protein